MSRTHDVQLLLLVPLDRKGNARVRGGGLAAWLRAHEVDEHLWAPFLEKKS